MEQRNKKNITRKFEAWFKTYVEQCDQKYLSHIDATTEKLLETKEKAKKIADIRMKTDMSQKSDLDTKLSAIIEETYKLEEHIENIKKFKEEMYSSKLKLTAEKVYDKLEKHPTIKKIEINNGTDLNIYTKKLRVKEHEIGNFKLTYSLPNTFFIRNLEYVVNGALDHWHVQYGAPCLASWEPILWRQIDTYQIFLFVDTLIHYLLLSNDAHGYMKFGEWISKFEAKEETKKNRVSSSSLSETQSLYLESYPTNVTIVQSGQTTSGWSTGTTVATNTDTWQQWNTAV